MKKLKIIVSNSVQHGRKPLKRQKIHGLSKPKNPLHLTTYHFILLCCSKITAGCEVKFLLLSIAYDIQFSLAGLHTGKRAITCDEPNGIRSIFHVCVAFSKPDGRSWNFQLKRNYYAVYGCVYQVYGLQSIEFPRSMHKRWITVIKMRWRMVQNWCQLWQEKVVERNRKKRFLLL